MLDIFRRISYNIVRFPWNGAIFMKKFFRFLVSLLLGLAVIVSIGWYLFSYDRDLTRDVLLSQARFNDEHGNSRMSSWFYDMAYDFSGQAG